MLKDKITVGAMELKNRLVMPPMATAKSEDSGMVTEELCKYYDEKSKGGYLGLIIAEHSYISPEGKASKGQLSISTDSTIDGLWKLTDVIHRNGSTVMAQISHAGGRTTTAITERRTLCPSISPYVGANDRDNLPKEMELSDITKVIDDFAAAAVRAKKAGFDGVEIHSAHGYLLNQFYSPLSNKRSDRYNGQTLEGRIALHLEVIQAVREAVGQDYPIGLRLGACDYMEGGTTIEDSVLACIAFEKAGIDLLDISGGFCGYTNPNSKEQGYFAEITQAIKKCISIPVILTGGVTDPRVAEALLERCKADLIGVGRAILKDSGWAERAVASK